MVHSLNNKTRGKKNQKKKTTEEEEEEEEEDLVCGVARPIPREKRAI